MKYKIKKCIDLINYKLLSLIILAGKVPQFKNKKVTRNRKKNYTNQYYAYSLQRYSVCIFSNYLF